jgi:hypothetical protein
MNTDEALQTRPRNSGANARAVAGDPRASRPDPWEQTLLLLDRLCATEHPEESVNRAELAPGPDIEGLHRNGGRCRKGCKIQQGNGVTGDVTGDAPCAAVVTLLDRLSPRTVALRWCSASCHYGYQIWVCAKARRAGVCAVSGKAIRRGDVVYRPYTRTPVLPVNVNAMIHPAALA